MIASVTSFSPGCTRVVNGVECSSGIQECNFASFKRLFPSHISLNYEEEIPALAAANPSVEFVSCGSTSTKKFAKPLVDFEKLRVFFEQSGSDWCVITNSDVRALWEFHDVLELTSLGRDNVIWAPRIECANTLQPSGVRYYYGLDFFCFHRALWEKIHFDDFALGVPWWDYALPTLAVLNGYKLLSSRKLRLMHLTHDQRWNEAMWRSGFEIYLRAIERAPSSDELRSKAEYFQLYAQRGGMRGFNHSNYFYYGADFFASWNTMYIHKNTTFLR